MCALALGTALSPEPAIGDSSRLTVSLATESWAPKALAKLAVRKDLSKWAPGFRSFLDSASCSGNGSVQHCLVTGSVSNDDVRADVKLTHGRGRVHYLDRVSLTAGMGGGTITRTFSGTL
jgi:hypothetical protein